MRWKGKLALGLTVLLGGTASATAQQPPPIPTQSKLQGPVTPGLQPALPDTVPIAPGAVGPAAPTSSIFGNPAIILTDPEVATEEPPLGPTPLPKVNILQSFLFGDDPNVPIHVHGWMDFDYTYRSTGSGINNIAPVMNRFGNEALVRQLGLYLTKPLDPTRLSWGFNTIFIAGADASFLGPTSGGWANTNPRFGSQFTDLNLTAHLPMLTEGGVDVKAGRQASVLGPMGALPWQRIFNSSDYAFNFMEDRYFTGVSANWHVSRRLDWYNGIEFGWGSFFDYYSPAPQYLSQLSYWLDGETRNTKVWTTLLTGPTGQVSTGNTTAFEVGLQHYWNRYVYQIVDSQMVYSKAPVFGPKPAGYMERAYDVYTYLGTHVNPNLDLNSRLEWYRDVDGGAYPGGTGFANTNFFAITVGPDYHPTRWLQFRPELRYDWATDPVFGRNYDQSNQLSIAAEVLIKF